MTSDNFHVLICGKIRDSTEFAATLPVYRRWRAQGLIERIVLSGWASDWDLHRELLQGMLDDGMEIVLSPEPNFIVGSHIFHQTKALRYGLSLFEPQDKIFKSRTDKAFLNFDMATLERRFEVATPPAQASPFHHRIVIMGGLAFQPFFFNDMLYVGEAQDLRKLAGFDLWFECFNGLINAEQAVHVAPYVHHDPLIRDYFMVNPGLVHADPQVALKLQITMLRQPFYREVLRRSLSALMDGYVVGFSDMEPWRAPEGRLPSLESIVRSTTDVAVDGLSYHAPANGIVFSRTESIALLLDAPVSETEPENLIELARPDAGRGQGEIVSEEAENFVRAVYQACQGVILPPPETFRQTGLRIYSGRPSLLRM